MFDLHLAKRGKIVVVADVGSASAGVAVALVQTGKPAEILAAERIILPMEEREKAATIAVLGQALAEAGDKALRSYTASAKKAPLVDALYCVIHAPWSRSRSVRAKTTLKEPALVTDEMIAGLAKQALADEKEFDTNNLLEGAVMRVTLNGYETNRPQKKMAREIAILALASDCDPDLRAAVLSSLEKFMPHVTPNLRSSTRALLTAIREMPDHNEDRLVVEIAGESTALTTIREDAIAGQRSVAEGVRTILKRLSQTGTPEETLSMVRMLGRDQCSTEACQATQDAMGKAEPDMVRAFGEVLSASAAEQRLPNNLLLIAQADLAPWLSKFFTRIDFTQFTTTTQPFIVQTLGLPDLHKSVTPAAAIPIDMGLALAVALVNTEQHPNSRLVYSVIWRKIIFRT